MEILSSAVRASVVSQLILFFPSHSITHGYKFEANLDLFLRTVSFRTRHTFHNPHLAVCMQSSCGCVSQGAKQHPKLRWKLSRHKQINLSLTNYTSILTVTFLLSYGASREILEPNYECNDLIRGCKREICAIPSFHVT